MLIDSHCHLESFYRKGVLEETLKTAHEMGVGGFVAVGTSPKDWRLYCELSKQYPQKIYWTAGLHPCDVDENWKDAIVELSTWFTVDPLPVALGEIGLDHFHMPKDPEDADRLKVMQLKAFRAQLELALQFDAPVIIHSRNAFFECVELIDESGVDWNKVVFHCFSEGAEEMEILKARGGRGSFTGVVTYKNAENVRQAALAQGLEKLMVETDSPYLTPVPHRGKPNQPGYTALTAQFMADLFEMPLKEFTRITEANTRSFYGI